MKVKNKIKDKIISVRVSKFLYKRLKAQNINIAKTVRESLQKELLEEG